ncbi:uncharacterized protein LOC117177886 [Belonocnema kinseyi]|uniref:uncharacterized protein LOC117177886 n=1 Tax=Belonocnema kinseyi TaxID=2817044 RepID=UPI00143D28BF|nr:uncharacterized protein LOC117177886 [Belonocnema kinseyi]
MALIIIEGQPYVSFIRGCTRYCDPPHCSHRLQPLDLLVFGPTKDYYKSQCSAWKTNNANKVSEIRQISGLVCATLDLALTPKTIKSGFAAMGISPFNPDIFTEVDFVQGVEQNAEPVAVDADLDEDKQRRIIFDQTNIGRQEEMVTSEPSPSETSTSGSESVMSAATTFSPILDKIGPLQVIATTQKNRRNVAERRRKVAI